MHFVTLKNFLAGLLGGVLGFFLIVLVVIVYPGNSLQAYIFSALEEPDATRTESATITPTPLPLAPDFWQSISSDASLSIVAVQVFKDNRIVKSGSGIILSSDGLVVIPADLTYAGSIYQILYQDKIAKGLIVAFDLKRNLAIIKITSSEFSLSIADFKTELDYHSGQDILIVGKLSGLSGNPVISQKGIISYVNGDRIMLDTTANTALIGAKVFNSKGELAGMLYVRGGKSYVLSSKDIVDFFREYLK